MPSHRSAPCPIPAALQLLPSRPLCVPAGLDTSTITSFTTSVALDYQETLTATATGMGVAPGAGGSLGCPHPGDRGPRRISVRFWGSPGCPSPWHIPETLFLAPRVTLPWGHRRAGGQWGVGTDPPPVSPCPCPCPSGDRRPRAAHAGDRGGHKRAAHLPDGK